MTTRWDNEVGEAHAQLEQQAAELGLGRVEPVVLRGRLVTEAILVESEDPGTVTCMVTDGRTDLARQRGVACCAQEPLPRPRDPAREPPCLSRRAPVWV